MLPWETLQSEVGRVSVGSMRIYSLSLSSLSIEVIHS